MNDTVRKRVKFRQFGEDTKGLKLKHNQQEAGSQSLSRNYAMNTGWCFGSTIFILTKLSEFI